jgi:signal transduction histidine kinase
VNDLLRVSLRTEQDVVLARQRARHAAELLGFDGPDQTRIATAVSEVARNAIVHAGGGLAIFAVDGSALTVRVVDEGPGMAGNRRDGGAPAAPGQRGLTGARRLLDGLVIETGASGGTIVQLRKLLPPAARRPDAGRLRAIANALDRRPVDSAAEVHRQNRELLAALSELHARHEDVLRLNQELEDTNRGVLALYAELDERAEQLRRANTLRAQFLSYMGHEFRTPLDSVIALSGLLLRRVDGDLAPEQEKQVAFIQRSARDLLTLVDDLLDTARADAGQLQVRTGAFSAVELFNSLRALLRPLVVSGGPALIFEPPPAVELWTDEAKVAQILRNLISNALKFTPQGEVRVRAEPADGERIRFQVADTGIGIPLADQERIFQDFAQVDSPMQRHVRGTGLGLPLSRKLAELLGGGVQLESRPGAGSTFTLELPLRYDEPAAENRATDPERRAEDRHQHD